MSRDPAPERGGTIPPAGQPAQHAPPVGAAAPTPQAALARYANLAINWQASTVASVERDLAAISIDQARAQALQAAASYTRDQTLAASGVANSGTVVAIAPTLATPGGWVLVTSEQTTGKGDYAGLPRTVHVIYAQVAHTANGYLISGWSPQT